MLSYKEYKLLNESLYGAFNLGLKAPNSFGGIAIGPITNGTQAAIEAKAEEDAADGDAEEASEVAIEEAKKIKKKMMGDIDVVKKVDVSDKEDEHEDEDDKDEDDKDDDHEDEDEDDKDDDHEDEDDKDEDEDDKEDDHEERDSDKTPLFMKKKAKKHMKKKAKKEWSEVMSDLEEILEVVDDEEALTEVKKGLEMMKKGMEKGMNKHMGCGTKKCGKYMNEEDQAWWNSVNGMLNSDPNQKHWSGWSEIESVDQAIRKEG